MKPDFEGHTPGPWSVFYHEDGTLELGGSTVQYTGVDSQAGFGCVAHVLYKKTNILGDSQTLQYKTFEANAKLIAAAPDLLKENQLLKERVKELEQKIEELKKGIGDDVDRCPTPTS